METEGLEIVYLELKYCERCGGLWLRRKGEADVYCESCSLQWQEVGVLNNKSGTSYARLRRSLVSDRRSADVLVVCPQEGKA